jgi:hypothetical protein
MERITYEEYAHAICKLVPMAKQDTSGSRAAAQVLLGTYNSGEFHCDLVDLALLDEEHFDAAIDVIRGRAQLRREPHELITNGDRHFGLIWERWGHLKISERYSHRYERN